MPSAIMIFKKVKVDQNVLFIDASKLLQVGRSRNVLRHKCPTPRLSGIFPAARNRGLTVTSSSINGAVTIYSVSVQSILNIGNGP